MRERPSSSSAVRRYLRVAAPPDDSLPELDGESPEMSTLKQHIRCVARDGDVTVLIVGESGTGKELVARAIHRTSRRHRAPFVVVNCAGLSPTLVEDELFGHVRGAFTGAVFDKAGPFERANRGTVFLDEVGDLAPDLQLKLLRILQQRTVQRLGGREETMFDVQVIAATNADLGVARKSGRFREDLYYRLKVYPLRIPPLRDRGAEDLRTLVGALLKRLSERRHRPAPVLASIVWERLARYSWPGNVRELENTLERMIVTGGNEPTLTLEHLAADFGVEDKPYADTTPTTSGRGAGVSPPSRVEVLDTLERHAFNVTRTAAALGLSRHQLYRLMKRAAISSGPLESLIVLP
ncbi:MAG: sigma-54 interaction domain-containing protein [Vicinamibacterales bacterium]